jgi:tripartite-type tricarboxylate transporter receptor subunit TctC
MVVPQSIGGSTDIAGRILAKNFNAQFSGNLIIHNKPGAGSITGTEYVSNSTSDGKTLLLVATSFTITAASGIKLPYDVRKDFIPITQLVELPSVVVVSANSKIKTLNDLNTHHVKVGYSGIGSSSHLAIEMFISMSKCNFLMVPYKGGGPALNAILSNEVDVNFAAIPTVLPFVLTNQLKPIAITSNKRFKLLKNVPTISEVGYSNYKHSAWIGILAPTKTPKHTIKNLEDRFISLLQNENTVDDYINSGMSVLANDRKTFEKNISDDLNKWENLIRDRNLKIVASEK